MYEVARYIPKHALLEAVHLKYDYHEDDDNPTMTTINGRCPLGAVLYALGGPEYYICPSPEGFANTMAELGLIAKNQPSIDTIAYFAKYFIDDWDDGLIMDLEEAFGLE